MNKLTDLKSTPHTPETKALTPQNPEFKQYLNQISDWQLKNDEKEIEKNFEFSDFKDALKFVNQVGAIAEEENHHPNILMHSWKKVRLTLTTHAVGGLTLNDFIVASKINQLMAS